MVEAGGISYDFYDDDDDYDPVDERLLPLTSENFLIILRTNISRVDFKGLDKAKGYLLQVDRKEARYTIEIDFNQSQEDQELTLVHEVLHAERGIIPLSSSIYSEEERIVEELSVSFYHENSDLVKWAFSRIRGTDQLTLGL